jgi:hypothetical protein
MTVHARRRATGSAVNGPSCLQGAARRGDVDPTATPEQRNQVINALLSGGDITLRASDREDTSLDPQTRRPADPQTRIELSLIGADDARGGATVRSDDGCGVTKVWRAAAGISRSARNTAPHGQRCGAQSAGSHHRLGRPRLAGSRRPQPRSRQPRLHQSHRQPKLPRARRIARCRPFREPALEHRRWLRPRRTGTQGTRAAAPGLFTLARQALSGTGRALAGDGLFFLGSEVRPHPNRLEEEPSGTV